MPITAWNCGVCKRIVPLDHFDTTVCGNSLHPDFAAAILADRELQEDRSGVRVTSGLGCPRSYAIMEGDVTVDPASMNSMLTGAAFHKLMERGGPDTEVLVTGTIAGIEISGKIDRVRRLSDDRLAIEDFKHSTCFARKYATAPKPEHIVQCSIYSELYNQQFGVRPTVGVIWQHYTSNPPFVPHQFDLWSLEKCLAHHPYDSTFSVLELYHQSAEHTVGKPWQEMELSGQSIKFGPSKTGCDYCSVYSICQTQKAGAPF